MCPADKYIIQTYNYVNELFQYIGYIQPLQRAEKSRGPQMSNRNKYTKHNEREVLASKISYLCSSRNYFCKEECASGYLGQLVGSLLSSGVTLALLSGHQGRINTEQQGAGLRRAGPCRCSRRRCPGPAPHGSCRDSPALPPPEHRPKVPPCSGAHLGTHRPRCASLQRGNPGWIGRSLPAPECRRMLRAPPAPRPPRF